MRHPAEGALRGARRSLHLGRISGAAALLTVLVAGCGTGDDQIATTTPSDAVAFQMNAEHTGSVAFSQVSFPATPAWTVDTGGTPSYPLIADGRVFVTVSNAGGLEVVAFDQKTGAKSWGPVAVPDASSTSYDSGRVFVSSSPPDGPALMEALDAGSGKPLWSTALPGTTFAGTPTASQGQVFVTAGGLSGSAASTLTPFGTLFALEETTGTISWSAPVQYGTSVPAVTGNGVYVSYPCWTYDFAPQTGAVLWSQSTDGCQGHLGGGTVPAVTHQLIFSADQLTGYSGDIYNSETGGSTGTFTASVPSAFTSDTAYFLQSGTLSAVHLDDDIVEWSFAGDGQLVGAPIVVNQYVIIGSASGNLYALDGTTSKPVWQVMLPGAPVTSNLSGQLSGLAAGDGLLVVPTGTSLVAYLLSANP